LGKKKEGGMGMSLTILIPGIVLGVLGVNAAVIFFGIDFFEALMGFGAWITLIVVSSILFRKPVERWADKHLNGG